jgi:hypothetical protein
MWAEGCGGEERCEGVREVRAGKTGRENEKRMKKERPFFGCRRHVRRAQGSERRVGAAQRTTRTRARHADCAQYERTGMGEARGGMVTKEEVRWDERKGVKEEKRR